MSDYSLNTPVKITCYNQTMGDLIAKVQSLTGNRIFNTSKVIN